MAVSKNWKVALAALLSASMAMSGTGFNRAFAADFIVAGGGGGGGGGAGDDNATIDPGAGGGGGASYYGDNSGTWGAGVGGTGEDDQSGAVDPGVGGGGGASVAANGTNGDAAGSTAGTPVDPAKGHQGQTGGVATATDGGTGGAGGHATSDSQAFANNHVVQDFGSITGDLTVSGGNGGTAGSVNHATGTAGNGGVGGDAALKITGTNVTLGTVAVTGGNGGGDSVSALAGTPGTGGNGGLANVLLATDATVASLSITAGNAGATASGGSATFNGAGQALTIANSGAAAIFDVTSTASEASFAAKTLTFGDATGHTVTLTKGAGNLGFDVADQTVFQADTTFTGVATATTFSLGSRGIVVDGSAGGITVDFDADISGDVNALTVKGFGNTIDNNGADLVMIGKNATFDLSGVGTAFPMLSIDSADMQVDNTTTVSIEGLDKSHIGARITLVAATAGVFSTTGSGAITDSVGNSATLGYIVDTVAAAMELRAYNFDAARDWVVDGGFNMLAEVGYDTRFTVGGTLTFADSSIPANYTVNVLDSGSNNTVFDVNRILVTAQSTITLDLNDLEDEIAGSPTNYAKIGDIELANGADFVMNNVAAGIWTGNLTTNDNVSFGSGMGTVSFVGKDIVNNVTGAFNSALPLISNGGNTLDLDGVNSWTINADTAGRQLLEAAVADPLGYVATENANLTADIDVTLTSGFYNGLGYIDNATGQLMAIGPRLFNLNSVSSQNPLMATNAMTNLLAGGGGAVGKAASTFTPMGTIGGECSGVQFGAFGYGSYDRYKVGSGAHVRSNDFHVVAGPGIRLCSGAGVTDVGVFFEGGWGDYDAYTRNGNQRYSGDGDSRTLGGGLLLRHGTAIGLYGEASFRAGEAKNTYDGLKNDRDTKFTSRTGYYGAHAGLGYVVTQGETGSLDISAKGFWSKLENDTARTHSGERVEIEDVNSYRSQVAVQYSYNFGGASARVMAGWEYEFDGKAKGMINTDKIRRLDTMRGHSGIAEVGLDFKVAEHATVGMGVHGSIGKRKGWGGSVQVGVGF